jgi:hypothetical protein
MADALDRGSSFYGFKSHREYQLWVVGRAAMHPAFNRYDLGSTPRRLTIDGLLAQLAEHPPLKRKCVGSKPTQPTGKDGVA